VRCGQCRGRGPAQNASKWGFTAGMGGVKLALMKRQGASGAGCRADMRPAISIMLVGLSLLVGCARSSRPAAVVPPSSHAALQETNPMVTIVGIPRYYVTGVPSGARWGEIYGDTNGVDRLNADGVVLEIISPKEYQGKMYGMHDDAALADHYFLLGCRYELSVRVNQIGRFSFGACTAVPFRKLNADEK
jgi:hypothetical protein